MIHTGPHTQTHKTGPGRKCDCPIPPTHTTIFTHCFPHCYVHPHSHAHTPIHTHTHPYTHTHIHTGAFKPRHGGDSTEGTAWGQHRGDRGAKKDLGEKRTCRFPGVVFALAHCLPHCYTYPHIISYIQTQNKGVSNAASARQNKKVKTSCRSSPTPTCARDTYGWWNESCEYLSEKRVCEDH